MKKTRRAESSLALQLVGVLVFILGVALLFVIPIGTIVGLILMLSSLRLGYKREKVWKCSDCGYYFRRD